MSRTHVRGERLGEGIVTGLALDLQFFGTLQTCISMFDKDLYIHCQGYIGSIRCEQNWNAADRPTHQDASRAFSTDLGAALSVSVCLFASSTFSRLSIFRSRASHSALCHPHSGNRRAWCPFQGAFCFLCKPIGFEALHCFWLALLRFSI